MEKIKGLLHRYGHALLLLYFVPYIMWFNWLEANSTPEYWVRSWLDGIIPFNELFVIPYVLWFFYVAAAVGLFLFKSRKEFIQICALLYSGMTICLIIYTIFPNGQAMRPLIFPRDNIFTDMVRTIYLVDNPFNVCPSIHCFNSMAVHIAIRRSEWGKQYKWLRYGSGILMTLICMSTVFLKQHSIEDFFAALLLLIPLYLVVYRREELVAAWNARSAQRARRPKYKFEQ